MGGGCWRLWGHGSLDSCLGRRTGAHQGQLGLCRVRSTELWGNMPESERNALFDQVGKRLPVGRVGEADDLAETYLYLMYERFSTGAMIVVDGGGILV